MRATNYCTASEFLVKPPNFAWGVVMRMPWYHAISQKRCKLAPKLL